jgi:hypothetical protein
VSVAGWQAWAGGGGGSNSAFLQCLQPPLPPQKKQRKRKQQPPTHNLHVPLPRSFMRSFIRSSPQIALHFPLKDTPLMVGCSDGCTYSIDALEALEEAGYTCLVGLKG